MVSPNDGGRILDRLILDRDFLRQPDSLSNPTYRRLEHVDWLLIYCFRLLASHKVALVALSPELKSQIR